MYLRDAQGNLRYFPPQAQGFDPFMDNRGPVQAMPQMMIRQHMQQDEWTRFNAPPPNESMHYQAEQRQHNMAPSPRAAPMSMGHMIAMQGDPRFFNQGMRAPPPPVMVEPGCFPAHVPSPMNSPNGRSQSRMQEYEAAQPGCMDTLFGSQVKSDKKASDPPTDTAFGIKLPSHYSKFMASEGTKNKEKPSPMGNAMQVFHCNGVRGPGKFTFQPKMPQCHGGATFGKAASKTTSNGDPPVDDISVHDSFDDKTFIMDMDVVAVPPHKKKGRRKKTSRQKSMSKIKEEVKPKDSLEEIREQNSAYESAEEGFAPAVQELVQPKATSESEDSKNITYEEVVATKTRRSKKQRDTVSAGPVISIASHSPETVPSDNAVDSELEEASILPGAVQKVNDQVAMERQQAQMEALAALQAAQQQHLSRVSPETVAGMSMAGVSVGGYVEMERQKAQREALAALQALQQAQALQQEQQDALMAAYGPPPRTKSRSRKPKSQTHSQLVRAAGPSGNNGFTAQDQALLVQNIRDICLRATPELDARYPSFDEPEPKDGAPTKPKSKSKKKREDRTSSPELSEVSGTSNGENKQSAANKSAANKEKKKKKKSKKENLSEEEKKAKREKKERKKRKKALSELAEQQRRAMSVLETVN
ncbi:MAG: hypothetical protein SGILL_005950 [Bacillariaceae sp.]